MDKILFLDIDGVMNSHQSTHLFRYLCQGTEDERFKMFKEKFPMMDVYNFLATEFCPVAMANLHYLVKETGCMIVLSSAWRYGATMDDIKEWFLPSPLVQAAFIDKTPSFKYGQRGEEIYHWLMEKRFTGTFAVVDDDNDMDAVRSHFFKTDEHVGLDWFVMDKIMTHLNDTKNIWRHYEHDPRAIPTTPLDEQY